jgi:hypothetical protein
MPRQFFPLIMLVSLGCEPRVIVEGATTSTGSTGETSAGASTDKTGGDSTDPTGAGSTSGPGTTGPGTTATTEPGTTAGPGTTATTGPGTTDPSTGAPLCELQLDVVFVVARSAGMLGPQGTLRDSYSTFFSSLASAANLDLRIMVTDIDRTFGAEK